MSCSTTKMDHIELPSVPQNSSDFKGKLYLGSAASVYHHKWLDQVDYVISLYPISHELIGKEHDMFTVADDNQGHTLEQMKEIMDLVGPKIARNLREGKNVLVHCFAGVSRSATVVIDFLCKYYFIFQNDRVDLAVQHVLRYRRCIHPNKGFMDLLRFRNS